jgi:hypothetical protein
MLQLADGAAEAAVADRGLMPERSRQVDQELAAIVRMQRRDQRKTR